MKLELGKNIYKYRKLNNLTQKQLAERINVSIAAVSKWETEVSYPDVEILPRLARCLNVSTDGLLGFIKELSVEEINLKAEELKQLYIQKETSKANELAEELLNEYPEQIYLMFRIASVMMLCFSFLDENQLISQVERCSALMEKTKFSDNSEIAQASITSLITLSMMKHDLEKALEYTDLLTNHKEAKRFKANIIYQNGKIEEASKLTQELLIEDFQNVLLDLVSLSNYQNDRTISLEIIDKAIECAETLEFDRFKGNIINLYIRKIELEQSNDLVKEYLNKIRKCLIHSEKNSILFNNLELKYNFSNEVLIKNTIHLLEMDSELDKVRELDEFKELIIELKKAV